jgi:hypothetical protein
MALDIEQLAKDMLAAALPLLGKAGKDAASFATIEFKKIAQTIVAIGEDLTAKRIDGQQAELLLDMQKLATRNVLLTIEGLGLLAVEAALNAALDVIKKAVNAALGIVLIA